MSIYDDRDFLKLSPSQISLLLDKCSHKWWLKYVKGLEETSLIDTVFPGGVVHFVQETAHPMKKAGQYFDPDSREFKLFVYRKFMDDISMRGYRIKKAVEEKYRIVVDFEYPNLKSEKKKKSIVSRRVEKEVFQMTLKCCQVYLKDIFPLQNPAFNDDGSMKIEGWCTLDMPKEKIVLRMRYDLIEDGPIITDTKVISPTMMPPDDHIKQLKYMQVQEQYMYYSLWHYCQHGYIPMTRQYSIKKNKTPVYVPLPDVRYNMRSLGIIKEKIVAAKRVIESGHFHGSNQSNLCSEDYCGFYTTCKFVHR